MADMDDVLVPNPDCPVREVGDGFVVMTADGGTAHPLDNLEAFIWRRLDGRHDLATIHAAILSEYEVEQDVAANDLLDFADALLAAGLVYAV